MQTNQDTHARTHTHTQSHALTHSITQSHTHIFTLQITAISSPCKIFKCWRRFHSKFCEGRADRTSGRTRGSSLACKRFVFTVRRKIEKEQGNRRKSRETVTIHCTLSALSACTLGVECDCEPLACMCSRSKM